MEVRNNSATRLASADINLINDQLLAVVEAAAVDSVQSPIDEQPVAQPPQEIPRRRFLKGAGAILAVTAGVVTVGVQAEWTDSLISRQILEPDVASLKRTVPPELQGKHIDAHNEHYQTDFSSLVTEGIDEYVQTGGTPYYRRPAYYLSQTQMLNVAAHNISTTGLSGLQEGFDDTSSQRLLQFSGANFRQPLAAYKLDPGSGAKQRADSKIAALGARAQEQLSPDEDSYTRGDIVALDEYSSMFHDAKSYIDELRGDGRVSTSKLFTYYLHRNEGDIVGSMLDTTMFLKLAARCDVAAFDEARIRNNKYDGMKDTSYENAKMLSDMFYDDFAEELPLEHIIPSVAPDSELNNCGNSGEEATWKDYDPVNRAGMPYHIWNIMALTVCADPAVAQKIVLGYYHDSDNRAESMESRHGIIKVEADMHAVAQANKIRAAVTRYEVA